MPRFPQSALPSIPILFLLAEFLLIACLPAAITLWYTVLCGACVLVGDDEWYSGRNSGNVIGEYSE